MIAISLYDYVSSMFDPLPPNAVEVLDTFFPPKKKAVTQHLFSTFVLFALNFVSFIVLKKKKSVVPGAYTFCASPEMIFNFLKKIFDSPQIGFHIPQAKF